MARRKSIAVETDNSNWQAPKVRKKRKPMTDEQRVAAAARLEKARQKRAEKNPDYGKSGLHESIRDFPDDHILSPKKVKDWIKTQKDLAASERRNDRAGVKGAKAKVSIHEGYVRNMQIYLKTGNWVDIFYGEYQQNKMKKTCIAQAYHFFGPKKGLPKFDIDVYYPMLGCMYTQEMWEQDNPTERGISNDGSGKGKRSRKRNTGPVEKKKSFLMKVQ